MLQICEKHISTHTYFILNFYNGIFTNWHGMIMAWSWRGSWKIWMHLPMSGDVLSNAEFPRGKRERGFCYCHFRKANALKSLYIVIYNLYIYISLYTMLYTTLLSGFVAWLSSAQFSELQSLQLHQELRLSSMHLDALELRFVLPMSEQKIEHNSAVSSRDHLSDSCWFLFAIHISEPWHKVFDFREHLKTSEKVYLAMFGRFQDFSSLDLCP